MTHPLPPLVTEAAPGATRAPVEPSDKGLGLLASATDGPTPASLAEARPPLHAAGFSYPVLTLRESALANNLEAMAAFCARAGVELAPHGKTGMSPELAARQLASGAWGITVATIGQLLAYRSFGFPRLLMANELVDEAGITWLAGELAADPGFTACCYVDSADGVAILDRVLTEHPAGRRLPVLVEIGAARTGCRTDEQALAVARAAAATATLTVAGVAGYEGSITAAARSRPTTWSPRSASAWRTCPARSRAWLAPATGSSSRPAAACTSTSSPASWPRSAGRDDRGPAQRRVPLPRSRALPGRDARRPRGGRGPRAPAGPGAVGAGAVPPRARPGPAQRGPPRRRLRRRAAGAAAGAAPGRGSG